MDARIFPVGAAPGMISLHVCRDFHLPALRVDGAASGAVAVLPAMRTA
jgi:hypothetical protein